MRRPVLVVAAVGGGVVAWTLLASLAYAWLGKVPCHCWFYYAVPWPSDFLWSGLFLIISGSLATLPFLSIVPVINYRQRNARQSQLYGRTGWASDTEIRRGGIERGHRP